MSQYIYQVSISLIYIFPYQMSEGVEMISAGSKRKALSLAMRTISPEWARELAKWFWKAQGRALVHGMKMTISLGSL